MQDQLLDEIGRRYPKAGSFDFGDSPELSRRLIELVRLGRKTATCAALRHYQAEGIPLPEVGRHDIALDHAGRPALVIQTTWVDTMRFIDVDWSFACDEGEDETLEGWRRGHKEFFARNGGFDPSMMLVCQRFRLVEDLLPGEPAASNAG